MLHEFCHHLVEAKGLELPELVEEKEANCFARELVKNFCVKKPVQKRLTFRNAVVLGGRVACEEACVHGSSAVCGFALNPSRNHIL